MTKTLETNFKVGQWVCVVQNGKVVYSVIRYLQVMPRFPFERGYITDHGTFYERDILEVR